MENLLFLIVIFILNDTVNSSLLISVLPFFIKPYMFEFQAKWFNTIFIGFQRFSSIHLRYIFKYLSVTYFRIEINDSQHAEILGGE